MGNEEKIAKAVCCCSFNNLRKPLLGTTEEVVQRFKVQKVALLCREIRVAWLRVVVGVDPDWLQSKQLHRCVLEAFYM